MSDSMTALGITFEHTMDAHSRKVYYHGDYIGMLLFHDWEFKVEGGPAPFKLKLASAILERAKDDQGIAAQKVADERELMVKNARARLSELEVDTTGLSEREIVERYIALPTSA